MKNVLLTVSGNIAPDIDEQIAQRKRPMADYIAMARAFNADLLDYRQARQDAGWFGKLLDKVGGDNLLLAWRCFRLRRAYPVIFTDGEQVGIPLALFFKFLGIGRRARHLMISHILSVPKKMVLFDWLELASQIDLFFPYATWQKNFIESRWKVPPERVIFTPFMVDTNFFAPEMALGDSHLPLPADPSIPVICAVGLEFRDYPTLIQAVKGLNVHLVIAAASPWSKRADTTVQQEIPENVSVQRFSQYELRNLYAVSRFTVMPLFNVNFQAGVTAILEAMAMERAVICSRTPGQTDVVVEGETGMYVPPQDPAALRQAIQELLDEPQVCAEMGKKARQRILDEMSLECYVKRLAPYTR
jgi:glycosyltransferase involved in cell wall biosynthesis